MTIEEIKARIATIDARLDDDATTDEEFNALETEARRLTQELGRLEMQADLVNVRHLSNVNEWTHDFLTSFGNASKTRKISLNQARIFTRLNNGAPFIYNGLRYDCRGMDYRAGFSSLTITKI